MIWCKLSLNRYSEQLIYMWKGKGRHVLWFEALIWAVLIFEVCLRTVLKRAVCRRGLFPHTHE
jgi:hypothetical protein